MKTLLVAIMLMACGWAAAQEEAPAQRVATPQEVAAAEEVAAEEGGAAAETPELYVSLLTCSPGADAYTLFGHTALRVRIEGREGGDFVFNYGMFNFNADRFIYRFVKGETDYELGLDEYERFIGRYTSDGHTVYEQQLNLTLAQRQALWTFLCINYLPENRIYRYNCFYDNCTTRAQQAVERALGEEQFDWSASPDTAATTIRQILHQFTAPSPWTGFGIDLLVGSEADQPLTGSRWEGRLFIPSILQANLRSATILSPDGKKRPAVLDEQTYPPTAPLEPLPGFPLSPTLTLWILFVLAAVVSFIDLRRRSVCLWLDIPLYLLQGTAGLLVAFLFFLSEHPSVDSNWWVLSLNPLSYLLIAQSISLRLRHKPLLRVGRVDLIEAVNMAALAFTLLLFCLPWQWMHPAMLPVVLSLLLRSAVHIRAQRLPS